jgi:hypothetical protein
LAAAAHGDVESMEVTMPNTMAIVCLKHRTASHEGMRCKLSVHHGRLEDIPERDRYTTGSGFVRKIV